MSKEVDNFNDLSIAMSNELTKASFILDSIEFRIIFLAIGIARKAELTDSLADYSKGFTFTAKQYAECYGVTVKTAYKQLEVASESLIQKSYLLQDNKENIRIRGNFVIESIYYPAKSEIRISFTPKTLNLILSLKNNFTTFEIDTLSKLLKNNYAVRLFIYLKGIFGETKTKRKLVSSKGLKLTIEETRDIFDLNSGGSAKYKSPGDFNKKVIEPAVALINEHANFDISFRANKSPGKGGAISDFTFWVKDKSVIPAPESETKKKSVLSESQREKFAIELAYHKPMEEFANPGEERYDFKERLKEQLKDPTYVNFYRKSLKEVGFDENYRNNISNNNNKG